MLPILLASVTPPFVLRADPGGKVADLGTDVELMECGGPLLGVEAGSQYGEQALSLGLGDVLAMTTDGLTEAHETGRTELVSAPLRPFFGYDGLVRAVREELARHPSSLGDAGVAVAQRARAFAGRRINDDVCLLLARCIERVERVERSD